VGYEHLAILWAPFGEIESQFAVEAESIALAFGYYSLRRSRSPTLCSEAKKLFDVSPSTYEGVLFPGWRNFSLQKKETLWNKIMLRALTPNGKTSNVPLLSINDSTLLG
jgi:hypothetical protein